MSTTTTTYNVNQIKQLIELNGGLTNFSADFVIESKNFSPFKALIISETELNSGNPIVYQEVKDGKIDGNITNDRGVHDSYFILLKSDEPTECQVTINLKEVPINQEIIRYQEELALQEQNRLEQERNRQIEEERQRQFEEHKRQQEEEYFKKNKDEIVKENFESKKKKIKNSKNKINWFLILGIFALIGVGIWLFMKKKKPEPLIENKINLSPITTIKNIEPVVELPLAPVPTLIENPIPPKIDSDVTIPEVQLPIETSVPVLIETPNIGSKKNVDLVNKINNFFGK